MAKGKKDENKGRDTNGRFVKGHKGNGGRPKIEIDYDLVAKLAEIQCTVSEIANILEVSEAKLNHDTQFVQVHKKGLEDGKKSLRRLQWDKAKGVEAVLARDDNGKLLFNDKGHAIVLRPGSAPDTAMQIWLGKQYLEQREPKQEIDANVQGNMSFTFEQAVLALQNAEQRLKEQGK